MDDLVAAIATDCGLDTDTARTVAVVILKFLESAGPADQTRALIDALPGAREAMAANAAGSSPGLLGAFSDLSAAGLGTEQIQTAARSFGTFARGQAGDEAVDAVVSSIPGLGPFV
ncbi:DUF2267 domain-containing protein [Bauldia sp.]|uniref:DUF2267 domain-containing protein n=1 Tax=Bauldia sp. TaxID=2575872 RepID=UPI003BA92A77